MILLTLVIMKSFFFLLCVAYASCFFISDENLSIKDKIVGGDFTSIKRVSYQASLFWFDIAFLCGASIIHESWIITAAHCVENKSHVTIRTGSDIRDRRMGTKHTVEKIIMHPNYDTQSNDNDIALIKLEKPIELNENQMPIPIAKPYNIPREGQLMKISGFGKVGENLHTSTLLKSAYVPIMNQENCAKAYIRDPITDNMFCAGDGSADACQGDSGGPGVIEGKLYGIVSSGMKCASKIHPGIYTRVYKYYDWIVKNVGLTL